MNALNRIKEYCFRGKNNPDIQECMIEGISGISDKICIICLDNFKDGETIIRVKCNHYYHTQCIYNWFEKQPTCPLCDEILKIS
jgi:hypothetical protein|tara:strand:+ start:627 stop:878 length:252 start_codon:yes stop_codon:yes gene_type:complete